MSGGGGRTVSRSGRPICASAGFGLAAGKKVVISLMKWNGYWNADGSEARASLPWLLENAIHGVFPLGIGHFISEISAFFVIGANPNYARREGLP